MEVPTLPQFLKLEHQVNSLAQELAELKELLDKDVIGTKAAARIAGVSKNTLEVERDRPGTKIQYKKVGRSVSYSLQSLLDYKKGKRRSRLNLNP